MWFHGYPPTVEVARRILLGANTKNSRRLWWLAMWGNNSSDIHVFSGISTQDLSFERLQCRKKQKMAVWGSAKLAQKNHHLVSWASKTAGPPLIHWGIPRPRRSQALSAELHTMRFASSSVSFMSSTQSNPMGPFCCHVHGGTVTKRHGISGIYMIYPVISRSSSLYTFVQLVCGYESMRTVLSA